MESQYPTWTAARVAEVSVRQVDYWATSGLLKPSGQDAKGKGTRRLYTFRDLVALKAVAALRARGCPLQKIRAAIKHLKAHYPDESNAATLARLILLTDGKTVYLLHDEGRVMEVVSRQLVWSVPIGLLIREVHEQVRKLPEAWDEEVSVNKARYRLRVVRDADTGTYTVQCRELPAAISEGDTAEAAIEAGREAIRAVLAFMARRKQAAKHVQAG